MARPRSKELTERELEIMHVFWSAEAAGELTVADVRDALAKQGRDLAYTTVATLVRILAEKDFLEQTNAERPFLYRPLKTFDEVSQSLLGDLIEKVFGGSREKLLLRLVDQKKLSQRERQRPGIHLAGGLVMHALGLVLFWAAIQVTVILLAILGVLRLMKTASPLSRIPIVLAGLLAVLAVSAFAVSPWPSWPEFFEQDSTTITKSVPPAIAAESDQPTQPEAAEANARPESQRPTAKTDEPLSVWSAAWSAFVEELESRPVPPPPVRKSRRAGNVRRYDPLNRGRGISGGCGLWVHPAGVGHRVIAAGGSPEPGD